MQRLMLGSNEGRIILLEDGHFPQRPLDRLWTDSRGNFLQKEAIKLWPWHQGIWGLEEASGCLYFDCKVSKFVHFWNEDMVIQISIHEQN